MWLTFFNGEVFGEVFEQYLTMQNPFYIGISGDLVRC